MIFRFAYPFVLLALVVLPFVFLRRYGKKSGPLEATIRYSDLSFFRGVKPSLRLRMRSLLPVLRMLTLGLLVLALARPQSGLILEEVNTEGVDIMLALDVSSSMRALDFKPKNRLDVAKEVATEFIKNRRNDRIGLIVFAGETYVQCPLTLDYGVLLSYLRNNIQILMGVYRVGFQEVSMIEDGTAIGTAIARSVKRLKDSQAKSKIVILVTDGANTAGEFTPEYSAEIAQALGIRVYTIGVGREEAVPQQQSDPLFGTFFTASQGSDLDVATLQAIADTTDGKFYLATDPDAMQQAFEDIDELERTEIKVDEYEKFSELYLYFLYAGLGFFLLEMLLTHTWLRKLP